MRKISIQLNSIQAIQAALENVKKIFSQKIQLQIIVSCKFFLLKKKKGQSATKKNHKEIGLSKTDWLRTKPVLY